MKDRRGFLKLLGIGAGAACAAVAARIATQTPTTPPRTIQDIEAPKPYIGPDSVPGGDYIKERPPVIPGQIIVPKLTPEQHQWIVDGQKIMTFDLTPPPQLMNFEVNWDTDYQLEPGALIPTVDPNVVLTTGTYDHSLGGYPQDDAYTDEFGL